MVMVGGCIFFGQQRPEVTTHTNEIVVDRTHTATLGMAYVHPTFKHLLYTKCCKVTTAYHKISIGKEGMMWGGVVLNGT